MVQLPNFLAFPCAALLPGGTFEEISRVERTALRREDPMQIFQERTAMLCNMLHKANMDLFMSKQHESNGADDLERVEPQNQTEEESSCVSSDMEPATENKADDVIECFADSCCNPGLLRCARYLRGGLKKLLFFSLFSTQKGQILTNLLQLPSCCLLWQ